MGYNITTTWLVRAPSTLPSKHHLFAKRYSFFPLLMFFYLNVDDLANQLRGETLLVIVQLLGPFEEVFHKLLSLGKIVNSQGVITSEQCFM